MSVMSNVISKLSSVTNRKSSGSNFVCLNLSEDYILLLQNLTVRGVLQLEGGEFSAFFFILGRQRNKASTVGVQT